MQQQTTDISDLLKTWIGQLVRCEKESGKTFTARLIAIGGKHLFFEDRTGRVLMDSISSIKTAGVLVDMPKDHQEFLESVDRAYQEACVAEVEMEIAHRQGKDSLSDEEYEELARIRKGI